MQQTTGIRVPTAGWAHSLEEIVTTRLRTLAFATDRPTTRYQAEHECPCCKLDARAVRSFVQFGRHDSSSSSRFIKLLESPRQE